MKLLKALYLAILLALPFVCMGNANRHVPLDTVVTTTFRDTILLLSAKLYSAKK